MCTFKCLALLLCLAPWIRTADSFLNASPTRTTPLWVSGHEAYREKRRLQLLSSENNDNENNQGRSILDRFTAPVIDDPALPISDALIAQIVAPTLEIFWLGLNHAPTPTWLLGGGSYQMSLLPGTLIHGAALATCWLGGALAARAYEKSAFAIQKTKSSTIRNKVSSYLPVLIRVLQAGAFATGLLILSTQLDLFWEFGGRYVQVGDSEETDFRLLVATVELINDVFFEAITLIVWRLYHASTLQVRE